MVWAGWKDGGIDRGDFSWGERKQGKGNERKREDDENRAKEGRVDDRV